MPTAWIYRLKKPELTKEAEERGLLTQGLTVEEIRKLLVDAVIAEEEGKHTEVKTPQEEPAPKMDSDEDNHRAKNLNNLIKEWNLTFRTLDNAVEFVERLEELVLASGIEQNDVLPALPRILQGKALLWYRNNAKSWQTWDEFLALFKLYYFPSNYEEDLIERIVARKQSYGESFTDYLTDLQTLMRRYNRLTEREQIHRIHENMLRQYKLYIKKQDYSNLTGLLKLATEYERISATPDRNCYASYRESGADDARISQTAQWGQHQVSNQPGTSRDKYQIHEKHPNGARSDKKTLTKVHPSYDTKTCCWSCGKPGHDARDCRSRRQRFCSGCGTLGVLSTNCCKRNRRERDSVGAAYDRNRVDNRVYAAVDIMGQKYQCLVDTGATNTYINWQVYEDCISQGALVKNARREVILANGRSAPVGRSILVDLEMKQARIKHWVSVLPSATCTIIGMDVLKRVGMKITWAGDELEPVKPNEQQQTQTEPSPGTQNETTGTTDTNGEDTEPNFINEHTELPDKALLRYQDKDLNTVLQREMELCKKKPKRNILVGHKINRRHNEPVKQKLIPGKPKQNPIPDELSQNPIYTTEEQNRVRRKQLEKARYRSREYRMKDKWYRRIPNHAYNEVADSGSECKIRVPREERAHAMQQNRTSIYRMASNQSQLERTGGLGRSRTADKKRNDEITSVISQSQVSVIVGAAGCGKSTRAPLAVLRSSPDAAVIVSGPRRVAAVGLARRVASELGEQVGDTVGYQVRLDSKPPRPPAGSVLYCTSGVLLRRLQTNPGLNGCSHVFVDEAHERDVNTDVTLLLLRRAVALNPRLRVVVMSATLDTGVLTRYFNSCPVVEVPGRTFPVETSYLDDIQRKYNLELTKTFENCKREDGKPQLNCQEVVEVVKAVDRTEPEGAILVFLPGWAEIKQAKLLLDQCYDESTHLVLPVHSRLSTTDQARMFSKPLPGVRKIVLATNIAETSITIPDVVYVVDSGAHKENTLKEGTGTASLDTVWVSRAAAQQRAGRAGRVQPGHCLKLYTKDKEDEFMPFSTPEILRVPLEQTVLDCKTYAPNDKVKDFLSQLPEPPSSKAIQLAVSDLIDLGALSTNEQLTRLGSLLSSFTVHPRLARGLLASAVLGNSVAAAHVLAHCADNVEVFTAAADRKEEIREIKREFSATSDHAALHWIQEEFERARARGERGLEAWCARYGLRKERLAYVSSISNQYLEQLLSSPIVQPAPDAAQLSRFSAVDELTPAALLCGANSLLFATHRLRTKGKLQPEPRLITSKGDRAHIGGESVNHAAKRSRGALFAYFGGFHSRERRALVIYKTSRVSPQAALLLCQGDVCVGDNYDDTTVLRLPRHRIDVHVPTSQVEHILKAREMLSYTLEYYIERDPSAISYEEDAAVSRFKVRLVKAIGRILVEANKEFGGKSIETEEFR